VHRFPRHLAATALVALAGCAASTATPSVQPRPSAHAAQIAFHSDPDGHDDLYLVDVDGTQLTQLTDRKEAVAFPYWSPEGSRIAFLCCAGNLAGLFVMAAEGSGQRTLVEPRVGEPAWSPDGSRIAYVDYADTSVRVVSLAGGAAVRLADGAGPSWSPDGARIAYFSGTGGDHDLWIMKADGTDPHRITGTPDDDVTVTWSPRGDALAFVRTDAAGGSVIEVAGADGANPHPVSDPTVPADAPSWSPDGTRILFTAYLDGADPFTLGHGNAEVMSVARDGGGLRNLTNDPAWQGYPAWSPDGKRVAYSTNDGTEFNLLVANADGSGARQLPGPASASGTANDCCPAWRP
jgi:Tol biopolymer transport system component